MTATRPRAALITLLAALLACSPSFTGARTEQAAQPTAPTARPTPLAEVPPLDQLDIEEPPGWLEDLLASQPVAPEPAPAQLAFELSPEHSLEQTVGAAGGTLELEAGDGVTYTLEIPEGALLSQATITMTRVAAVEAAEADGESLAAVKLQPEGLVLLKPAKLRIELPQPRDPEGYLGFSAGGDGENAHARIAVDVEGVFELSVPHFSMYGTVSGRHSNNARLLRAAISNSTPNGAAQYYGQDLAQVYADWQNGEISQDLFTKLTIEIKRDWFWRNGDGVYYSLLDGAVRTVDAGSNRIAEPHLLERAIAHYIEWYHIEAPTLRDYYNIVGVPYPFELEEALANRLITQGIKEGLEADCFSAIDALYKIRLYRLGLALNSSSPNYGVKPYSATSFPEFTQDYALEKVQACARFELDYVTHLALELPHQQWEESGSSDELSYVFAENPEVVIFKFDGPPEDYSMGRAACEGSDGFITIGDLRWPLNIFHDPNYEFQEHPLEVDLSVVEAPGIVCGQLPLPPFWILHRLVGVCPLKFELEVARLIDRDHTDFIEQYECRFTDPEGNPGVFRDEILLLHEPDNSIFQ